MINANEIRAVLTQCGSWRKARHLGQQCDEMTPSRLTDLLDTLSLVGLLQYDAERRLYSRTQGGSEWLERSENMEQSEQKRILDNETDEFNRLIAERESVLKDIANCEQIIDMAKDLALLIVKSAPPGAAREALGKLRDAVNTTNKAIAGAGETNGT